MDDAAVEVIPTAEQQFFVGDIVEKKDGDTEFWGEVKCAYELSPGVWRYDVMAMQKGFRGLVHIYSTKNLRKSGRSERIEKVREMYAAALKEDVGQLPLYQMIDEMADLLFK